MKAGVVLAFLPLEFMSHVQSHPSHTWLILASPLGLKKPGTWKPLRTPGLARALGLGVDTTCSLRHLGRSLRSPVRLSEAGAAPVLGESGSEETAFCSCLFHSWTHSALGGDPIPALQESSPDTTDP